MPQFKLPNELVAIGAAILPSRRRCTGIALRLHGRASCAGLALYLAPLEIHVSASVCYREFRKAPMPSLYVAVSRPEAEQSVADAVRLRVHELLEAARRDRRSLVAEMAAMEVRSPRLLPFPPISSLTHSPTPPTDFCTHIHRLTRMQKVGFANTYVCRQNPYN